MASHNFKKIEFSLRGARFLVTFWKKKSKIDLLLVFYCLDGFQVGFLAGAAGVSTKACASSELAFRLRGGSFSFFLTKIFGWVKRVFLLGQICFAGKGGLGPNAI